MKTSPECTNIICAILALQAKLKPMTRTANGNAEGHDYKYVPLDVIVDKILPSLAKKGVALFQDAHAVSHDGKWFLSVETRLVHSSGEWVEGETDLPLGQIRPTSNEVQAAGGVITYGRRYALCLLLGIVADSDDDAASAGARPQTTAQRPAEAAERPAPAAANEVEFLQKVVGKALACGKITEQVHATWMDKLKRPGNNLKAISQTIMTNWGQLMQQRDPESAATPAAAQAGEPPAESYEQPPTEDELGLF